MTLNFVIPQFSIGGAGTPPLQFFRQGFILGGIVSPSWRDIVVSGIGSVTLTNAKENGLNYVKAFGACEQTDNVLPSDYTRLDYVTCNNDCRVDTNIIGDETTVIKARFRIPELQNMYVYGCQSSNNTRGITAYITTATGNWRYGNRTNTLRFEANKWYKTIQSTSGISVNGTLYPYGTVNDFETPHSIILGTSHSATGDYGLVYFRGDLGEFSIEKGSVLVANYIPCKNNTTNKYGFYDTVSETFKPSETANAFAAGETLPTPHNPVPIKCNNGAIKVNQQGQIYTDGTVETITITGENFEGGTATCENLFAVGEIKDIQSILNGDVTRKVGIKVFDGTEAWTIQNTYNFSITKASIGTNTTVLPNYSLRMQSNYFQIVNYASKNNSVWSGNTYINFRAVETFTTVGNWKAWLAEQYNSGNPVILLYPLANTTTQTVTAQPLSIQEGTNTIEITQASLNDLELKVKYQAGVTVTVEETQNSTLDNSVTVTIS